MTMFIICVIISMIMTRPIRVGLVENYLRSKFYSRWEKLISLSAKKLF